MPRHKISRFVEHELERFRRECNFTAEERLFFDLRARDKSMTEIIFDMRGAGMPCSESKLNGISRSVSLKISRVLDRERFPGSLN